MDVSIRTDKTEEYPNLCCEGVEVSLANERKNKEFQNIVMMHFQMPIRV